MVPECFGTDHAAIANELWREPGRACQGKGAPLPSALCPPTLERGDPGLFTEEGTDGGSPRLLRGTGLCPGHVPRYALSRLAVNSSLESWGAIKSECEHAAPALHRAHVPPVPTGPGFSCWLSAPPVPLLRSGMLAQGTTSCISAVLPAPPSPAQGLLLWPWRGPQSCRERGLAPS